jgi:hypothetical protein
MLHCIRFGLPAWLWAWLPAGDWHGSKPVQAEWQGNPAADP